MSVLVRAPVSGEVQLVAELGNAQDKLIQAELAAEVAISAARGAVTVAQSRVDEFRTGWCVSMPRRGGRMLSC